jgi:NAD(P)H-dependent flavin oxidoreductase YrpB (nitropropane dioxygenase family)
MSSNESKTNLSRRAILKLTSVVAGAGVLQAATRAFAQRRDHALNTRLSRQLGLRVPLASAGMAFVGLTELASAVSNAGALGVYGVGNEPPPVFATRLAAIQDQTSGPFGVDFLVASTPAGDFTTQDHIDIAASAGVPVVVFHWNVPERTWVDQLHAGGSKVWMQTSSLAQAQQAVALGVDGIVAQGRSAGGHNRNSSVATWRLVAQFRRALPSKIFILASGGVSDGQSLVRAIRAGADGGWAGTVFVAASESYANEGYKARLIAANGANATQFTTAFGPEWPDQQQRVLRNAGTAQPTSTLPLTIGTTKMFPGILDIPYTMPKHSAIVPTRDTVGNLDEMDMPAGSVSIKAVKKVRSAAEIVDDFVEHGRHACERDDELDLDED